MVKTFEALILAHGSLAVFFIGILEELIFILPSAAVFFAAGFFLIQESLPFSSALFSSFIKIGIPAGAGVAIGSLFIYGVVYWGGKPAIERWGKYVGLRWGEIEAAEKKFISGYKDEILLFLFRALPIFPISVISAVCGLIRLPWKEFMLYTFLGATVRAGVSSFIGWRVGKAYVEYAAQFEAVEKYGLIILVILGGVAYWYLKRRMDDR